MANRNSRYKQMELYVTSTLLVDLVLFIIFLVASGAATIWLKVITAILSISISLLCLAFLYMNKEIYRQRSLWMSMGALAILICTLFSLILNFPSPNPLNQENPYAVSEEQSGDIAPMETDTNASEMVE